MSSAGHVLDMIKRSRYNESIKLKRIEQMRIIKGMYHDELRRNKYTDFRNADIDSKELEKIKRSIRNRIIANRKKNVVFSGIATIVLVVVIVTYLFFKPLKLWMF